MASPHASDGCTGSLPRTRRRRTGSDTGEQSAREQKTSTRYQCRPCSHTLYTSTHGGDDSTTTSLSVCALLRPCASCGTLAVSITALASASDASEIGALYSTRSLKKAALTGSSTVESQEPLAAPPMLLPRLSNLFHPGPYCCLNGLSARVFGSADQSCMSCRLPTRRSHVRSCVVATCADWKADACASEPNKTRKSSNSTNVDGSTSICLWAEAQYSPSCRLISCCDAAMRLQCDSHSMYCCDSAVSDRRIPRGVPRGVPEVPCKAARVPRGLARGLDRGLDRGLARGLARPLLRGLLPVAEPSGSFSSTLSTKRPLLRSPSISPHVRAASVPSCAARNVTTAVTASITCDTRR
eukprot:6198240-Pleurochrysis_carterae.AAC.1